MRVLPWPGECDWADCSRAHSPPKGGRPSGRRWSAARLHPDPGWTPLSRRVSCAEPDGLKRARLPARDHFLIEIGDRVLVHAMKVEPRAQAQKRAAEADRRALEKDKFARHRQATALGLQSAHHLADLASAVFRRLDAVGGGAHAIVENGATHETRPHGHRLGHAGGEPRKAPHLEGVHDASLVVRLKRPIELDHAVHEPWRKNAHAAVIEQIDAIDPTLAALKRRRDRIVAEMWIAVNDAVAQERAPPRLEQADGNGAARFLRRGLEGGERLAVEPFHREQSPRRQAFVNAWHA